MDVSKELEALRLEREKLELEDLRTKVEETRKRKEARLRAAEQQERDIKEAQRQEKLRQEACQHRKGGTDLEGIVNGNSPDYSIIKHMMPWGELFVMCTRCQKQWRPGDSDYAKAVSLPTDNQQSGACLFINTYKPKAA